MDVRFEENLRSMLAHPINGINGDIILTVGLEGDGEGFIMIDHMEKGKIISGHYYTGLLNRIKVEIIFVG